MLNDILPQRIHRALDFLNIKGIREIRIRVKKPIIVDYGSLFYLGESGITDQRQEALSCSYQEMQDIVFKACECSVYAHNEELKQGFVTLPCGERIGIAGEVVYDDGKIKTIKNFSSINIRIPHQIPNCSLKALEYLYDQNGIKNTLIISSPGSGKTTFLRDLCYQISSKNIAKSILLVDERQEIASVKNGEAQLNVGPLTDIYTHSSKKFAIENGIRVLSPEVIFLDELANLEDIKALNIAIGSGVKLVATAHAKNLNDLMQKPYFQNLLEQKIFERFVVLSSRDGAGTFEGVFDKNQVCLN